MNLPVLDPTRPWYAQSGLRFTCTQCGNCCTGPAGYVWISDVELQRLSEHLKLSVDQIIRQYCRRIGNRISLKEHRNRRGEYDCIFLKEIAVQGHGNGQVAYTRRICTIYTHRPLQCRTWPFWPEIVANAQSWNQAARRCHGINRGRTWTPDEIARIRDATDWPADSPGSDSNLLDKGGDR